MSCLCGYLIQKILQVAGLQGELGQPISLSSIQVHEDLRVLIPGDAKLWKVELVGEAQDVSAGAEKGW